MSDIDIDDFYKEVRELAEQAKKEEEREKNGKDNGVRGDKPHK